MKFQNILLFVAATTLAYAQLSDVEDSAANEIAGIASEVDDAAPVANAAETAQEESDVENYNEAPMAATNENEDDLDLEGANDADETNANDADTDANEANDVDDAAEGSDDYDAALATDGEFSDDYEEAAGVDQLDAAAAAADANAEESDVDDETTSNTGAIAAGVAGATAAAAGVFLWAKKSKKEEIDLLEPVPKKLGSNPFLDAAKVVGRCTIM